MPLILRSISCLRRANKSTFPIYMSQVVLPGLLYRSITVLIKLYTIQLLNPVLIIYIHLIDHFCPLNWLYYRVIYTPDSKIVNTGTFTLNKEDHTMGNILRCQLLRDPRILFAGYRMPHPLINHTLLRVCHHYIFFFATVWRYLFTITRPLWICLLLLIIYHYLDCQTITFLNTFLCFNITGSCCKWYWPACCDSWCGWYSCPWTWQFTATIWRTDESWSSWWWWRER